MSALADVVVIGGGIAGVSIGYELAAQRRVVVVEQEQALAHHTTGRSAAVFLESLGPRTVRALTTASRAGYDRAPDELGTDVLLTDRGALMIAPADQVQAMRMMQREQPALVELDVAGALEVCSVLHPDALVGALYEPDASDIDVLGLHQGYVRGFATRGGEVRRAWRAIGLAAAGNGRWRVSADDDTVECADVVLAAGAWCDELAVLAGARPIGLRPMRRTIAVCPAAVEVAPHWPLVSNIAHDFYWRPEGPNVLCSPADETPSGPCDTRPEELDVALAVERANASAALGLRSVQASWAGLRTFAKDRVPVAGADPDVPGLWWLAGQGGYGIQTAPAMARCLAGLMAGGGLPGDVTALGVVEGDLSPARFV